MLLAQLMQLLLYATCSPDSESADLHLKNIIYIYSVSLHTDMFFRNELNNTEDRK